MVDGVARWEITNAGALVIGIVAIVVLVVGLICVVRAISTPRDKPGRSLKWTWISILMSAIVLVGMAIVVGQASTYPRALLIESVIGTAVAEILIVAVCISTAIQASRRADNSGIAWFVLAWALGTVIIIAGWLPQAVTWVNTIFNINLSAAMWALAFLTCLGVAGLIWCAVALTSKRRTTIVIVVLALVTGCAGLFVTLYQTQDDHADDLAVRFSDRFHRSVEFLDSDDPTVRAAGLQQLAWVADDYARHPELPSSLEGRDAAIDVIVTYLKTPFAPDEPVQTGVGPTTTAASDQTVRAEASRILHDHLDASSGGACESIAATKPADTVDHKGRTGKGVPTGPTEDDPNAPADETLNSGSVRTPEPASGEAAQCWADHSFDFTGAYFWQADFSDAYFATNIDFSDASFFGTTDFSSLVTEQAATFAGAHFAPSDQVGTSAHGWVRFDSAVFHGQTDFSAVVFDTHTPMSANKPEPVSDQSWDVSFVATHFDGDLSFHDVRFDGSVTFDQAEFSSSCYVDPDGNRNLGGSDYDRICSDDHPEWDNADFTDASFAAVCADQCRAGVDVEFTNAIFYSTAVFTGSRSTVLPEFWQAQFWDDAWLEIAVDTPVAPTAPTTSATPATSTTLWCVPLSDDMPSSAQNCWPTAGGTPLYTRVTLGPSVTIYLDNQAGHEGRCRVTSESSAERTKDADLTCS